MTRKQNLTAAMQLQRLPLRKCSVCLFSTQSSVSHSEHQRSKRRRDPPLSMTIIILRRSLLLATWSHMSLLASGMSTTISRPISDNRNPTEKVTHVRHDESTSNLLQHADNCGSIDSPSSRAMTAFANGSTYNLGKHRVIISIWIAHRHRPFTIVEDTEFIELLRTLNSRVTILSRFTVSRDIQEIFDVTQQKVAAVLQVRFFFSSTNRLHIFNRPILGN
jgi:hypothetical protein